MKTQSSLMNTVSIESRTCDRFLVSYCSDRIRVYKYAACMLKLLSLFSHVEVLWSGHTFPLCTWRLQNPSQPSLLVPITKQMGLHKRWKWFSTPMVEDVFQTLDCWLRVTAVFYSPLYWGRVQKGAEAYGRRDIYLRHSQSRVVSPP